jgi:hypothetical protein
LRTATKKSSNKNEATAVAAFSPSKNFFQVANDEDFLHAVIKTNDFDLIFFQLFYSQSCQIFLLILAVIETVIYICN